VADVAEGRIVVETLIASDWQRTLELVRTYADLPLGVTDASLIALAERHQVERIATLDHRHFRVVRPEHITAFALVP
jgi:predicted nucleic acid-binding protein